MASADFKKLHGKVEVKRILRHCDKYKRKEDKHTNKDINTLLTDLNIQVGGSYEDVCSYYDDLMAELDARPNANKRKDRVTAFSIEVPLPLEYDNLPPDTQDAMRDRIFTCLEEFGGVMLGMYEHSDEKHKYRNKDGKLVDSRTHIHAVVAPVMDGKLNGRSFSSERRMKALNREIEKVCRDFGMQFMTGEGKKSKQTVEELKELSEKREKSIAELQDIEQQKKLAYKELQSIQNLKASASQEYKDFIHTAYSKEKAKYERKIESADNIGSDIAKRVNEPISTLPVRLRELKRGNEFDDMLEETEEKLTGFGTRVY